MLKKKEYELQRLEINELFTQLPYTHSSSLNFKSSSFLHNQRNKKPTKINGLSTHFGWFVYLYKDVILPKINNNLWQDHSLPLRLGCRAWLWFLPALAVSPERKPLAAVRHLFRIYWQE